MTVNGKGAAVGFGLLAAACAVTAADPAHAQGASQIIAPSGLPRPGYDARSIQIGSTTISPELLINETYDSNVFAVPDNETDDLVTTITPSVRVEAGTERLLLYSQAAATHSEYLDNTSEGRTTYGTTLGSRYLLSRSSTVQASLNYDRRAESRDEPESGTQAGDALSLLDSYGGSVSYDYLRNRIGLGLTGSIQHTDFDLTADSDRDRTEGRISGRASFLLSPRWNTFLEGYTTRRDYEAGVDRAGLDRDETIYGFLAGTGINLTGKLDAEIGVGLFQTDNDDDTLKDFLGLGVRGGLRWSISPRTLLAASLTRQDVGTVLQGATSQIQTDLGVSLQQEVRHNFVLTSDIGLSQREYEGIQRDLTTLQFGVTGELFLNRTASITVSAGYSTRFADQETDEYDRLLMSLGLRFRF